MSRLLRLLLAFVSATVLVMALVGTTRAQVPASRVPQWTKIANFPIPEEELYGTAFNNKFYVLGGFGQGGMAPGLVFEYRPGWRSLDAQEGHAHQGASPGPGGLQRQAVRVRWLPARH